MKKVIGILFYTFTLLSPILEAQKLDTIVFQQEKITFYFFKTFQEFISTPGLNEQLNHEFKLLQSQTPDPEKDFESFFSDVYDNIKTIKGYDEIEFAYPDSDDEENPGEAVSETLYEQTYKKFEDGQDGEVSIIVGLNESKILQSFCFISQNKNDQSVLHIVHDLLIQNSSKKVMPFLRRICTLIKDQTNNPSVFMRLPAGAVLLKGALKKELLNADSWVTKIYKEEDAYCFSLSIDKLLS